MGKYKEAITALNDDVERINNEICGGFKRGDDVGFYIKKRNNLQQAILDLTLLNNGDCVIITKQLSDEFKNREV
jgi:hypothetical protein